MEIGHTGGSPGATSPAMGYATRIQHEGSGLMRSHAAAVVLGRLDDTLRFSLGVALCQTRPGSNLPDLDMSCPR